MSKFVTYFQLGGLIMDKNTNKYVFNRKLLKKNLKAMRQEKKYKQTDVAKNIHKDIEISRTTITNWENENIDSLPNIEDLMGLCNLFECDLDYVVGREKSKSKEIADIANQLHISEQTVEILKENKEFGEFIDNLLSYDLMSEVIQRTARLSFHHYTEDVITASFSPRLVNKIKKLYLKYLDEEFLLDMSEESFKRFIEKNLDSESDFDIDNYLHSKFLENGRNYLFQKVDNFNSLNPSKQRDLIISVIAEMSYDYLISDQLMQISKQKLISMMSDALDHAIKQRITKTKNRIKAQYK